MTRTLNLPDLHIQTSFSDGEASVEQYVAEAERRGIREIGIADHYSLWHRMDTSEKFLRYLAELQRYPVYRGVEIDIGYELPLLPSMRKQLGFVTAGLHRLHGRRLFFRDSSALENPQRFVREMLEVMVASMERHDFDVLAHPTQLPEDLRSQAQRLITKEWVEELTHAAAAHGVAIEVNCGMKLPDTTFVKKCLHEGVKISPGSSAHTPSKVGDLDYARHLIEKLKIMQEQIYRPGVVKKRIECRASIENAELEGKQLKLEVHIGAEGLNPEDLELVVFYEREGEVGRRIVIPSQAYPKVSQIVLALDYVPEEVDTRLYEDGDKLDQLVLINSKVNIA